VTEHMPPGGSVSGSVRFCLKSLSQIGMASASGSGRGLVILNCFPTGGWGISCCIFCLRYIRGKKIDTFMKKKGACFQALAWFMTIYFRWRHS
jgi:hypothetical protein